jgi:hypothetical protein
VVVTLGRVATQSYEASGARVPQFIGALDVSPQTRPGASGVSLAVDPDRLFGQLLHYQTLFVYPIIVHK